MPKKYLTSKLIKLLATLLICLLLIFLNPKNIFNPARNIFFTLSSPFQKVFYLLSEKRAAEIDFLKSIASLKEDNERLYQENNTLTAQIADLKTEKEENTNLRAQLNLIPKDEYSLEASFIIGQDPQKLGSWLMIDKGQNYGILPGMPVIVSDKMLVGKISEVYNNSAKVSLLTDSASSINAMDLDTSAKGIVNGEYGLGVIMSMVAQTDVINEGDSVVTSGLGGNMPKGLFIGTIQDVKSSADKLFQEAVIAPRVKYSELDVVFIIKNSK